MTLVTSSCVQSDQHRIDWSTIEGRVTPTQAQRSINLEDLALGKALFFSKALSSNHQMSCASCHPEHRAFQDGQHPSLGVTGRKLNRNTPSLLNIGWARYVTWGNLAFFELERHMMVPLFGDDPPEMSATFDDGWLRSGLAKDVAVLRAIDGHSEFQDISELSWTLAIEKIAIFMRSLSSLDSPWDRFEAGDSNALSPDAKAGRELFFSDRLACSSCHPPPFFSTAFRSGDAPRPSIDDAFANNGLYFVQGTKSGYPAGDPGIMEFTDSTKDAGRFRIPSLRNVEFTGPYMHDGSVDSLASVLEHYASGGRTINAGENQGVGAKHPNRDPRVQGFTLSLSERAQLIAFLNSLTGDAVRRKFQESSQFSN